MRIVHIEDFFHPEAGYQVNLLAKYMVKMGHEVFVVTGDMGKMPEYLVSFFGKEAIHKKDEEYYKKTGVKIIRMPIWKFVSGRSIYKKDIFKKIEDLSPDILYVHGNDTLIGIQYTLRKNRLSFPMLMDSHMLAMASSNRFSKIFQLCYKFFITPKIIKNNITVIRTQNDNYVKEKLGIPLKNCPWISTGTDTLLFKKDDNNRRNFRNKYDISEQDFVIVYAGKIDEAKGGALLAETFKKKITDKNGNPVVLILIGSTNGEYGKRIDSSLSESENRILRFPTQKYVDLANYYQAADMAVFPKQCSLSFYDVQACGLPTVIEDNNINIDRVAHNNGMVFKSESVKDFRAKIEYFANMNIDEFQQYSKNAIEFVEEKYDYMEITKKYMDIMNNIIKAQKK